MKMISILKIIIIKTIYIKIKLILIEVKTTMKDSDQEVLTMQ
jgi:hypothetical protein